MALWRKPLQFINVMLANRSPMIVAERGPGRMTYAKTRAPASGVHRKKLEIPSWNNIGKHVFK